jgi:hypothetical protein
MQRFFTKFVSSVVLSVLSFTMIGQTLNTLTINSPAGIAGDYLAVRAGFGNMANTPITGNAAFVDDGVAPVTNGCTDPTNNLTGLIAFVDRGVCQFGDKALRAEKKGAIAVVICNNEANAAQAPFVMVPGDFGVDVTVPTFMVSFTDCQKIRTDILAGGVNATFRNTCNSTAVYPANTVWGNVAGQGDFKGGVNGWIVENNAGGDLGWEWLGDGLITGNAFGGAQMTTWSACDGAMAFRSDYLDNGGDSGNQGGGPCPATCSGSLTSPTIDLSGQTIEGIVIEFGQATRQFQSQYRLLLSKDGGATWPDTFGINTSLPVNSNVILDRQRIAVPGYGGISSLKMRFEYDGNYYYWGIDDVIVLNEAKADIQVNENFYAGAPQLLTPISQVAPIAILADISNIGNKDAAATKLDYVVTDPANSNAVVFQSSKSYGNVTSGTAIENGVFVDTHTPEVTAGNYNGSYIISATGDTDPTGNNKRDFFYIVTDDVFGYVNPEAVTTPANYLPYSLSPWTIGTTVVYYTMAGVFYIEDGKNLTVPSITTGMTNTLADISESGFIYADVYEWDDADGDNQAQPTERTKVGTGSLFIDGSIANLRNFPVEVWALNSDGTANTGVPIPLKSKTNYIAALHTAPLDPSVAQYQFLGYTARTFSAFDRSMNYSAQRLAQDSIPSLAKRSAGTLFGVTGTSDTDVEDRTFEIIANGPTETAGFLEIKIAEANSTYDVDKTAEVSLFPNPAIREVFVDIALPTTSNVRIDLVAADGKIALSKSFSDVQDERLKMDINDVPSGAYTVMINTGKGIVTKKVIVQK